MRSILLPTHLGYESHDCEDLLTLKRTIWLRGAIDEKASEEIVTMLLRFEGESHEEITLLIHSGGGIIEEGLLIYDVMKMLHSPIRTVAMGYIASMASILFAAGTKGRRMVLPNSRIMIHEPLIVGNQIASVSQVVGIGEQMERTKNQINQILADCTGKPLREINKDTKFDKCFTAEAAVKYGLADGIMKEVEFA